MVGGREEDKRICISLCRNQCGNTGRWRGVAAYWLEQDTSAWHANLLELFFDEKAMAMVGENAEPAENWPGKAPAGLLE
jgi:hypothetical protein